MEGDYIDKIEPYMSDLPLWLQLVITLVVLVAIPTIISLAPTILEWFKAKQEKYKEKKEVKEKKELATKEYTDKSIEEAKEELSSNFKHRLDKSKTYAEEKQEELKTMVKDLKITFVEKIDNSNEKQELRVSKELEGLKTLYLTDKQTSTQRVHELETQVGKIDTKMEMIDKKQDEILGRLNLIIDNNVKRGQ